MAKQQTRQKTKTASCPTHGSVLAVKEVPVFTPPGLFYLVRLIGSPFRPYLCPQCGQRTR